LGYGKSRLTFADKTPGQGKRKAATPEKLKYLSPLKGGLKPGSTTGVPDKECSLPRRRVPALISRARIIPGTPFRIVPISEKSGAFIRLASPNESIRK